MYRTHSLLIGIVVGLLGSAPAALAQCGMPCGERPFQSGPAAGQIRQVYIHNVGNQPITLQVLGVGEGPPAECARTTMSPRQLRAIDLCGQSNVLVMHDGTEVRRYAISSHHRYAIFWNGHAWDLRDITDAVR